MHFLAQDRQCGHSPRDGRGSGLGLKRGRDNPGGRSFFHRRTTCDNCGSTMRDCLEYRIAKAFFAAQADQQVGVGIQLAEVAVCYTT